jgi:hypothetical protein
MNERFRNKFERSERLPRRNPSRRRSRTFRRPEGGCRAMCRAVQQRQAKGRWQEQKFYRFSDFDGWVGWASDPTSNAGRPISIQHHEQQ